MRKQTESTVPGPEHMNQKAPGGMEGRVLRKAWGAGSPAFGISPEIPLTRRKLPTAPAKSKGRPFAFCPPRSRGERSGEQGRDRTEPPTAALGAAGQAWAKRRGWQQGCQGTFGLIRPGVPNT